MTDLVGKSLLNRYRVDSFLGRGGMAEVYKVWDTQRATFLALKLLREDLAQDPVFLRRFHREANTLEQLSHPNIVRFYGLERVGLLAFILMDFVNGSSLRAEIFLSRDQGLFSYQRIIDIMRPVCSALHYAHNLGMVHCDMKPANIMVEKTGRVLVADFGIARMTDVATSTMVGAGTPAYMAPEQIRGMGPTPQTDIYALGVSLYEMLTGGERPFTGERAQTTGSTSEKVHWELLHLEPASLRYYNPHVSSAIEQIVLTCLAKQAHLRYQTSLDLLNALESAVMLDELEQERRHVGKRARLEAEKHEVEERARQETELQAAQHRMIEISGLRTIVLRELEHANWKAARGALAKLDSYGQEGHPIAVELRGRLEHSKEEAERLAAEKRVQREAEKRTQQEIERRLTEIAHLKAVIESSLKKEDWVNAEKALAKLMIQGEDGRLLSLELQAKLEQAKQENKRRETEKRAELTHFQMEAETALQNEDWSKLNANIAELKQRGHEGRSIANILLKQMKPIRRQKGTHGKPLWLRWTVLVAASFIFLLIIQIFGRQFITWPLASNIIFGPFNAVNSGDQDMKTTTSSDMTTAPGLEKESDSSLSGMTQEAASLGSYDEKSSVVITESDLTTALVQALQQNTDIPLKDVEIILNNEQINLSGVVAEGVLQGKIQITAKVDVLACKPKLTTPTVLLNAIPLPEVLFAQYLSVAEDSLHTLITTLGDEDLCITSILVDEGKMIVIRDRSIATHLPPTTTPKPSADFTPTLSIGLTQVNAKDGMVMVNVPAGKFIMGSETYADEKPQRTATLDAFWIDQTEVTNAMYARCMESGTCRATGSGRTTIAGYENYPVVVDKWDQSKRLLWMGWQAAANGGGMGEGRAWRQWRHFSLGRRVKLWTGKLWEV